MMNMGLLWYDNSAEDLKEKLGRAVRRYRERFGADPNVCYVHPTALPDGERQINQIAVRASIRVLRHHLLIVQEQPSGAATGA